MIRSHSGTQITRTTAGAKGHGVERDLRWTGWRARRVAMVAVGAIGLLGALVTVEPAAAATKPPKAPPGTERLCTDTPAPGDAACFALRRTAPSGGAQAFATPAGYGPAQLQSAYNLPSASAGAGHTVAIVDAYDLPTAEADLGAYRTQFGLPPCTTANGCFRKVNQSGQPSPLPRADSGWGGEIALDLDMVSAGCPNCKILLVEASSASMVNLGTAVNAAVALGAIAVSNSYGGSESSSDPTYDASYFNHPGVAITVSSGDSGFGAEYPAASQYVTAVGGTSLSSSTNARGWTESAWSGAGSGCSGFDAKPSWQHDTGCTRRTVADVSAVADPNTGVAVYDTYQSPGWQVFGGTSASSPLVASVFAMATPAAAAYPSSNLYANPGALFDVTSGSNGTCSPAYLCKGGAGYDGPTGLGTPNGVTAFGPTSSPTQDFSLSVTPGAATVLAGDGTTATVSTATTLGSAQTVSLSVSGLPSGATGSVAPSSVTSGGSATLTITTSASTLAGTYNLTITGTGTSGTHTASFSLTVQNPSPTCASGQKLGNPGLESGATVWSQTAGVIGKYTGTRAPHSGAWDAWLDGYGSTHTDSLSQSVTIPTGCTTYALSFWLHIDSAETTTVTQYDKLTVKLGTTTLATYSNLNKATGYSLKTFNVAGFAGQTVTLTFTGSEDFSLQTSFVIDDTALTVS
jgi:hypothetical protein